MTVMTPARLPYENKQQRGNAMIIMVNGKEETIPEPVRLKDFLDSKNIRAEGVVIELNREILEKQVLEDTIIKENDTLEILRLVGGG
jgi:sulfur carrier protein